MLLLKPCTLREVGCPTTPDSGFPEELIAKRTAPESLSLPKRRLWKLPPLPKVAVKGPE